MYETFQVNATPYYVIMNSEEEVFGEIATEFKVKKYKEWLENGLEEAGY